MIRFFKRTVFAALALLVPAAAHAQNTVYACVNSNSGTIKIVSATATCNNGDMKVSWDIVGPPGPQGPAGPQGPIGPQGPQGPAGPINVFGLTVSKTGSGTGQVVSSDTGIVCDPDCTEVYPAGTQVTLTATPASGSTFAGWSGDCANTGACTLTLSATRAVTAQFDATPVFLPDLIPISFTVSRVSLSEYVLTVIISNQGTAQAAGQITANFIMSQDSNCSTPFLIRPLASFLGLGIGQNAVTSGTLFGSDVPIGGYRSARVDVDPGLFVQESNETNNSLCISLVPPITFP